MVRAITIPDGALLIEYLPLTLNESTCSYIVLSSVTLKFFSFVSHYMVYFCILVFQFGNFAECFYFPPKSS
jgi:hypothetical protein